MLTNSNISYLTNQSINLTTRREHELLSKRWCLSLIPCCKLIKVKKGVLYLHLKVVAASLIKVEKGVLCLHLKVVAASQVRCRRQLSESSVIVVIEKNRTVARIIQRRQIS